MSTRTKPLYCILSVLFVLALAAGCQANPPSSPTTLPQSAAPGGGPTTLTLWHTRTGAEQDALVALARDFEKEYKDVTISVVNVGGEEDLKKKLVAAIALSRPPDVVLAPHDDIPPLVRQNGLAALDDLVADPALGLSASDTSDFFPGLVSEGIFPEFNSQRYSFPFDLDAMVLFYNADLLQSGGFNAPPSSWTDFSNMASKVTKDNQFGWAMNIDAEVLSGMLVSQGSAPLDIPEDRALFGERAGVASLTLAAELYKSGAAQLEPTRANSILDFAAGNAAFYMDWMSAAPELAAAQKKAKSFTLGVANLPQGDPREPFTLFTGADLAVLRTAPDRERQAWFLVRWLTGTNQTARWAAVTHAIPLRASALAQLDLGTNPLIAQIQKSLSGTNPHFVSLSANPHLSQIERLMEQAWEASLQPKADIGTTLSTANTNANVILAGNP